MSEVGKLKPVIQTIPIRPINKDATKKEQGKKEEGKELPQQDENDSGDHVDEFI
jgi:hypothetical protein